MQFTTFSTALTRSVSSAPPISLLIMVGSRYGLPSATHLSIILVSATRRALSISDTIGRASTHVTCLGPFSGGTGVVPPTRPCHNLRPTPSQNFTVMVFLLGLKLAIPLRDERELPVALFLARRTFPSASSAVLITFFTGSGVALSITLLVLFLSSCSPLFFSLFRNP